MPRRKVNNTKTKGTLAVATAEAPVLLETEIQTELNLDEATAAELSGYETEIRSLIKQTLENVVRLGEIFTHIKTNVLPFRTWRAWLTDRFDGEISFDTAENWMNVYKLHSSYAAEYGDGINRLPLSALYKLSTAGVSEEEREAVLEIAAESGQPLNFKDTKRVIQTYRKIKLTSAGLAPEAIKLLAKTEVAEDPKKIRDLQRLSKIKQTEVAEVIAKGGAASVKEAIQVIKQNGHDEAAAQEPAVHQVEVDYTQTLVDRYNALAAVDSESIHAAIIEAPLSYEYAENHLHELGNELERVLVPGGFAIITIGHKAAMYAGSLLEGIKPVHLLCLRRQPGNSRTIIGLNITSASVFAVLAYKAPYHPPHGLVVDLHTLTDTEALTGLDEVQSGLEKSFEYFLTPLLESGNTLLHHVVGSEHFNIEGALIDIAKELKVSRFVSVR